MVARTNINTRALDYIRPPDYDRRRAIWHVRRSLPHNHRDFTYARNYEDFLEPDEIVQRNAKVKPLPKWVSESEVAALRAEIASLKMRLDFAPELFYT